MRFKLIGLLVFICIAFNFSNINAQEENYRAEIGIHGGGSFYLGDANEKLFHNTQTTFGLIYRQKFNQRIAVHLNWYNSSVKGGGILPDGTMVEFNNPVNAIDFCGEFNFFDLEKKEYKPFSKVFSPFIFAGIGGILYKNFDLELSANEFNKDYPHKFELSEQRKLSPSIPFGIGMKVMLGDRLNLNVMWSNRILFSDTLEGIEESLNDPAKLNGTNIFNNDIFSTLSLGLTFNIWKDKCNCPEE